MQRQPMTEASIATMVDNFYAHVRNDVLLAPIFEQHLAGKWQTHMPRMVAFWTKILLGSGQFDGNVFGKHMALEGVTPEHFVHWLGLFRLTVTALFEPEEAAKAVVVAERIAGSLRYGFFGDDGDIGQ